MKVLLVMSLVVAGTARADPAESWRKFCLSCHGAQGSGDTKEGRKHDLPDMRTASWQASLSDEELTFIIRDGKRGTKMKPFGRKLNEQDLKELVAKIRSYGVKQR